MKVEGGSDGSLHVSLEEHEADLMRSLLAEMRTLLEADIPNDEIKERLFPRAFEEDELEGSYRELIGDELVATKRDAIRTATENLGPSGPVQTVLGGSEVETWLRLLTDLRLAIGTRLHVTEDVVPSEPDPSDPDSVARSVLHWLGWVQESFLERISNAEVEGDT